MESSTINNTLETHSSAIFLHPSQVLASQLVSGRSQETQCGMDMMPLGRAELRCGVFFIAQEEEVEEKK